MSWPTKTIGDVCEVVPGFAFKSKDLSDSGIPVIKIGNITESHSVDIKSAQCLPENLIENKHKKYFLRNGDILIAMTGATAGKVGRIRCAEDQVLLLNQRVAKLCPVSINPDFFWSAISTDLYRTVFYGLGGGAAQPNMSSTQIESVEIPYPTLVQQKFIASIISAYDDLIENNRRRIQLLEQAARLLYKEWFVYLRFPGHEHTKIIDGVPEGWERKKVKDLLAKVKRPGKIQKSAYLPDGPIPCIDQSREFIGGYTDQIEMVIDKLPMIVFGDHTRILKFIDFPFACGADGTQLLAAHDPKISQEFFFFSLDAIDLSNYFYARHFKFLKDQYILRPTDVLIDQFTGITRPIMNQVKILREQNGELAKARDLLLPKLMNGEVAV
jgi:type I restriction enzyme S subunit